MKKTAALLVVGAVLFYLGRITTPPQEPHTVHVVVHDTIQDTTYITLLKRDTIWRTRILWKETPPETSYIVPHDTTTTKTIYMTIKGRKMRLYAQNRIRIYNLINHHLPITVLLRQDGTARILERKPLPTVTPFIQATRTWNGQVGVEAGVRIQYKGIIAEFTTAAAKVGLVVKF